ncbi:regulation of nuclear pre-mRNA domain-containing protein 2-like [Tripterygium wilfordii]|uniref:Regulation of nuclear pre-mRNA domain-containing protein 2-like n=1 Tax=Tripterygium wilfordii TaxID=458696 RepID=A0A7J7DRZ3_TRIWF|nr:regulation of nuclear pre-mRNA domain-containing protein 1B-like isoform X1 [Tripterygium wilfordii]XP_038699894.1 regulation of nuclear pre-mRNA domain-containing protein 1B-like isoform X1 [Tripterygium wilfordii]KAF5749135.1 regulation of nuclear pre-mRNA domain-containing protein 2-like [Tripterygium wilfordii]
MNNDAFDGQILSEKLSKLNNSQQSIESLSRWCMSHRKKARQIVETWGKLFRSSQREQRVSFLYLANDILQNSRRKGSEFVNEFWKVLPAALGLVYENGDEHGKKAVTRLVDIWEERKVFGSRGQSLKDEMLSKNPPSTLQSNGKSSNPIKIVKRDAYSVRIKLTVGGLPEKILTAFQSVLDENVNEESALSKCCTAVSHVGKIVEDIENASSQGNQLSSTLVDDLQEQENVLCQCVEQLENAEAARAELVSQLREALQEQESKLEVIRSPLQVARGQFEQASSIRKRVMSSLPTGPSTTNTIPPTEAMKIVEQIVPSVQPFSTPPQPFLTQPVVSYAPLRATDEESKKAAAAAVAAKLAASTSSAQMLTSVLSSLVAEEAASMNGSLKSSGFTSGLSIFSPEKRQKLEKPMAVSDGSNSDAGGLPYFTPLQPQPGTNVAPTTSVQSVSQPSQVHTSYAAPLPLPPPPPLSPANPSTNQFVQSAGTMVGVMPYGYGANVLPPPPPLPPHITMGLARPAPQPPQQLQPQPQQSQEQQSPANGGYYRPPGIGFYGQSHQPTTPAVPRQ